MEKKLLITGFDPFGGETVNPAWEAVKKLPDRITDYTLYKLEIPTVFGLAAETVLAKAAQTQPDLILCIGQAGGRAAVTPERIAVNIRDARIPDNAGNQPGGEQIAPDGPAAYFATVPVKEMAAAIQKITCMKDTATCLEKTCPFIRHLHRKQGCFTAPVCHRCYPFFYAVRKMMHIHHSLIYS